MALVLVVVTMFVSVGVISTMTRLRPVVVAFVRFVSIVVTIMMIVMTDGLEPFPFSRSILIIVRGNVPRIVPGGCVRACSREA